MTYLPTSTSSDSQKDLALQRVMQKKRTLEFICLHPEGVTSKQIYDAGCVTRCLGRLQQLGVIRGEQIREPERGARAYHWLWKPSMNDGKGEGE